MDHYQLTNSFTVVVGQEVDRNALDQAVQEAKSNGVEVRVCAPGARGDTAMMKDRLNIHLDLYNEVMRINFG